MTVCTVTVHTVKLCIWFGALLLNSSICCHLFCFVLSVGIFGLKIVAEALVESLCGSVSVTHLVWIDHMNSNQSVRWVAWEAVAQLPPTRMCQVNQVQAADSRKPVILSFKTKPSLALSTLIHNMLTPRLTKSLYFCLEDVVFSEWHN